MENVADDVTGDHYGASGSDAKDVSGSEGEDAIADVHTGETRRSKGFFLRSFSHVYFVSKSVLCLFLFLFRVPSRVPSLFLGRVLARLLAVGLLPGLYQDLLGLLGPSRDAYAREDDEVVAEGDPTDLVVGNLLSDEYWVDFESDDDLGVVVVAVVEVEAVDHEKENEREKHAVEPSIKDDEGE